MTVKFQCAQSLWSYIMLSYFIRYLKKYDDKTFFILTNKKPARVHPLLSTTERPKTPEAMIDWVVTTMRNVKIALETANLNGFV
jgi:hypothetical protein